MRKVCVEAIKANWESVSERPTWSHVTTAELVPVIGVHLQTLNNWKLRGILPKPVADNPKLRGNKNYYRISAIRAWLEKKSEDEIHREWVRKAYGLETASPQQLAFFMKELRKQ